MAEYKHGGASSKGNRVAFGAALIVVPALLLWLYFAPQPGGDTEPSFETLEHEQEQTQLTPLEQMEQMWRTAPGHGPVALELANLYYQDGQYEKAVQFYREFLKNDTTSTGWLVHLDLSRSFSALGRADEAIGELQLILKDHSGHSGALYNLGAIEANRGNHDAARKHWTERIGLHPQDTLAVYAQGALPKLKPVKHP
ncbi:MAG: tetratricopeptide repeat protein [bacterium]|nr:tetratricopeptide repeat protein [bacterium]